MALKVSGSQTLCRTCKEYESGRGQPKKLKSYITFDDGSNWSLIPPPSHDSAGEKITCDPSDIENCSLHFHSVTNPHNFGRFFSSPAPGFVMGVGSIGESLKDISITTLLSTDVAYGNLGRAQVSVR